MKNFKMTPKLKLAEMIYKSKEMELTEKVNYLKEIKNLNENELEEWIEIDVLIEGPIGKVIKEQMQSSPTSGKEARKAAMSTMGMVKHPVVYSGYRTMKAIFSKCARKCGAFRPNTVERQRCLAACKQQAKMK